MLQQALEKENMALRLKLKHAQSHLNVIASESPLALKLNVCIVIQVLLLHYQVLVPVLIVKPFIACL